MPEMENIRDIALRLGVVTLFTWLTLKWLMSHLEPNAEEKKAAKKNAKVLLKKLGISKDIELDDNEYMIAQHLTNAGVGVDWSDIGGYDHAIEELKSVVLLPMKLAYRTPLLCPPRGVLLHGPPGCGKTMLAKAVAKQAGARFINMQFSTLTNKWYGESNKLVAAMFSLIWNLNALNQFNSSIRFCSRRMAEKLEPTIIFIDEIDSLLRSRASHDHEATAMLKAEFMSLWDGFDAKPDSKVVVMGATNRPRDIDPAILRRMPLKFYVGYPDVAQRLAILEVILRDEYVNDNLDLNKLAAETHTFSGSDLREVCRLAVVRKTRHLGQLPTSTSAQELEDFFRITQSDLVDALSKFKQCRTLDGSMLTDDSVE